MRSPLLSFLLYTEIMDDKAVLRIKAKSIRKTLDIEQLSNNAVQQIRQNDLYQKSGNILIFHPMRYEINLLDLTNDDKNFYLPKVCADELLVCPYSEEVVKSGFGVCEPCTNPIDAKNIELAIVPALMIDREGYRLGYGGGFYDRFLSANPHIKTIAPIAKELFAEKLPHEDFDIKIDCTLIV